MDSETEFGFVSFLKGAVQIARTLKWLSLALCLSFAYRADAQTVRASSCNAKDVQKALNSVKADGAIVNIPAGSCHWTTIVTYNQAYSTTIQGAGAQTPGGGIDQTIIYDNVNHGSAGGGAIFALTSAAGKNLRITGIAVFTDSANPTTAYNGVVAIYGKSKSVRIDHNHFHIGGNGTHGLQTSGWLNGVIDHNLFDQGGNIFFIEFASPGWNGTSDPAGYGNSSWADGPNFGTGNFMFAEDNTFTGGGWAFDCIAGARFVFRNNTLGYHTSVQTHGLTSSVFRGCRAMEVYNNTLTYSNNPSTENFAFVVQLESGTGLWWGNTITGFVQFIHEDTVRTNKVTYPETAPPNGWGYCGSGVSGALSPWDGNTNPTGYPCIDQVGRGKGDIVTGKDWPNLLNTATGTIAWPHQASEPVYVWNNTFNTVGYSSDAFWANADSVSVENRDYYLQLPNVKEPAKFNGTAGIGQGPLSGRPGTCTPFVGYWATDQKTLYQCTAANTWTAFYTPFTYPHPLTKAPSPKAKLEANPEFGGRKPNFESAKRNDLLEQKIEQKSSELAAQFLNGLRPCHPIATNCESRGIL